MGFQDELSLNAGQKYCKGSILQYFPPLLNKIFDLSIFERSFYTGFTASRFDFYAIWK